VPIPTPRFTDRGNGTVRDNLTGLIWLKEANCFGGRTWAQALTDANALDSGSCGLTDGSEAGDWRLPNVKELRSLIDFDQSDPALSNGHPFLNLPSSWHWSSTTFAGFPASAWHVLLDVGNTNFSLKTNVWLVWPVRGPE
jgi:hypothetical protein